VTKHGATLPLRSKVGGALLVWFEPVFGHETTEVAAATKDVSILI
jgi:hypothetical protein